jgi:hypothetical protein
MSKTPLVNNFIKYILITLVVKIILDIYNENIKLSKNEADIGEYSDNNNYKYVSPMKDDIFKQIAIDIFPIIFTNLLFNSNKQINLIQYDNIDNFTESIIGKIFLSSSSFIIYYQIIKPHIINKFRNF